MKSWKPKFPETNVDEFTNLDNINKDVDRGIDCKHEMVPPGENFCPGWPHDQLLVVDHLVGLVGAGDQLGGVAAEEHQHYGGEKGGHGGVAAVVSGYRVVEYCRSGSKLV